MSEETKDTEKKEEVKPVRVFRNGAIAASIWRRRATGGYEYFDFTLSRSWKYHDGKGGYSKNFYASNESQISHVVSEAAAWIAQQQPDLYPDVADIDMEMREAA